MNEQDSAAPDGHLGRWPPYVATTNGADL